MNLVEHVQQAFEKAEREESKLPSEIYTPGLHDKGFLQGMSSPKVRHFMNNLCDLPDTRYLEIGTYAGSTLVSAAFHNPGQYVAIDKCCWNHGKVENSDVRIEDAVRHNLQKFGISDKVTYFVEDCWDLDKSKIPFKANVYFYDGDHSHEAQKKALTEFKGVLDSTFIFIVDDWKEQGGKKLTNVARGTQDGIQSCGLEVVFEMEAPPGEYHQGMGIFVLRSPNA